LLARQHPKTNDAPIGLGNQVHAKGTLCGRPTVVQSVKARPKDCGRLVVSVTWPLATAVAKAYTAISWNVGLSHEDQISQGGRSFIHSKLKCAAPLRRCLALPELKTTSHAKGSFGSWEISGLAALFAFGGPQRLLSNNT
jgi:hypothetical protein